MKENADLSLYSFHEKNPTNQIIKVYLTFLLGLNVIKQQITIIIIITSPYHII